MAFKMRGWTPKGDKKMFGGKSPAYTKKSMFKQNNAFVENKIEEPVEQTGTDQFTYRGEDYSVSGDPNKKDINAIVPNWKPGDALPMGWSEGKGGRIISPDGFRFTESGEILNADRRNQPEWKGVSSGEYYAKFYQAYPENNPRLARKHEAGVTAKQESYKTEYPFGEGEDGDLSMVHGGNELDIAKKNKDFLKGEEGVTYVPGEEPQILELSAERAEELLSGIKREDAPKEYLDIIRDASGDGSKTAQFHYTGKKYLDKDQSKSSKGKGTARWSNDENKTTKARFDTKFFDWLRNNQNRPEEKIKLEPTIPSKITTGSDTPTIERGEGLTPSVSIDAPIEKPELRSIGTRKKEVAFGDAFKEARASGKAEFTWKGKRFHSRRADETKAQWRDKMKKIQDNLTVNK